MKFYLQSLLIFLNLPVYLFSVGAISGVVRNSESSPLSGAAINLYKNQVLIASTTTGMGGTYSLTNLSPGAYDIQASKASYQTVVQAVNVKNNQTVIADFALLPSPGSINGKVTDADTADPISSALITITQNNVVVATATTNLLGEYTAIGIPPGSYLVTAQASGYQTGVVGAQVTSDHTTDVSFALEIKPGTLEGTVRDSSTMDPIENAIVQVSFNNEILFSRATDVYGTYSIEGIPPGSYIVQASASGYQTSTVGAIIKEETQTITDFLLDPLGGILIGTVTSASTGALISNALVEVNSQNIIITSTLTDSNGQYIISGLPSNTYVIHVHATNYQMDFASAVIETQEITNVNFSLLSNPGTLSGTVISSVDNQPIPGATVEVISDSFIILSTTTDSAGKYSIPGIFSGNFTIHVHASNYQTAVIVSTLYSGQLNIVDFSLNSNPASIFGTVTELGSGDPIPRTLIEVHHNGSTIDLALTDNSGNYMITGLPSISVTIHAHNDEYQTGIVSESLIENMETEVNFSLELDPSQVNGTIRDAISGIPIMGAFVYITIVGDIVLESALTTSNGTYSIGGLFPESYIISAQKQGYISNNTPSFNVSSGGETLTEDLALYPVDLPPRDLTGKVLINRFMLQVDRIHQLQWEPSISPEVVEYRIYRNSKVIANVDASHRPLIFYDHDRSANIIDTYVVTSINSDGSESSGPSVMLQ